ncbi:basic salivary proline-rich protein 3-like [Aplysia californica]|uniref:Basic salivary proline-rich protein 3-like n=1 Tax=Aplysia californica TaxID=6500 RepID=A0ABM1ADG5_APLCA|nr:basic salivary proline-rich protein 3-like [Aplysia californica]
MAEADCLDPECHNDPGQRDTTPLHTDTDTRCGTDCLVVFVSKVRGRGSAAVGPLAQPQGRQNSQSTAEGTPEIMRGAQSRDPHPQQGAQSRDPHPQQGAQSRDPQPQQGAQSRDPHPQGAQSRDPHPQGAQSRDSHPQQGAQSREPHPQQGAQSRDPQPQQGAQSRDPHPQGAQSRDPHPQGAQSRDSHPQQGAQSREPHPQQGAQSRDPQPQQGARDINNNINNQNWPEFTLGHATGSPAVLLCLCLMWYDKDFVSVTNSLVSHGHFRYSKIMQEENSSVRKHIDMYTLLELFYVSIDRT